MDKIVIKTKSIESRNYILELIKKGVKIKCCNMPGLYAIDKRFKNTGNIEFIGVFCEKITIYYK